jgi:hypothetical protein
VRDAEREVTHQKQAFVAIEEFEIPGCEPVLVRSTWDRVIRIIMVEDAQVALVSRFCLDNIESL